MRLSLSPTEALLARPADPAKPPLGPTPDDVFTMDLPLVLHPVALQLLEAPQVIPTAFIGPHKGLQPAHAVDGPGADPCAAQQSLLSTQLKRACMLSHHGKVRHQHVQSLCMGKVGWALTQK